MPLPKKITSVSEFIDALSGIGHRKGTIRYFRGHADYKKFTLTPSVYRAPHLIKNERRMIEEAIIRCPADFPDSMSTFERLVRLQHYGLPTRLLDLTTNALVALYFACLEKERTEGEVIVLDIPLHDVKYYNSDTVSILSNVSRCKGGLDIRHLPDDTDAFNKNWQIDRLFYDVKEDKPAFRPIIEKEDLGRVLCVKAKLDNARIARQDGAFLIFGIDGTKSTPATVPDEWIKCGNDQKRIIFSNKHRLKRELESFGVSGQSLFPELASQSEALQLKFKGKYLRKKKKFKGRIAVRRIPSAA